MFSRPFSHFLIILLLTSISLPAHSAEDNDEDKVPTLEQVTVVGQAEDQLSGSNTLDRKQLDILPAKNSSISEAISVLPGVQLPEQSRSSLTAGEIVPPKVAISGGKTYQNNIRVDGVSNNNIMDPEADDPTSITFVPAHPESLFINTRLVEDITLYRYNVPASLGSFTGGVVDIKTRQPSPDFFGELTYRTTNDKWTDFHIDRETKEEFDNSTGSKFQPEFSRHDGGFLLNVPLNHKLRLLTSYQINYSEIPLTHLLENKKQERKNENYLVKLAYDIDSTTTVTANLIYAPYEGKYFYTNSYQSDFTIDGGGLIAGVILEKTFRAGDLTLQGSWKQSINERKAPTDLRPWQAELSDGSDSSKPWGLLVGTTSGFTPASFEGSIGSLETRQESILINTDFASQTISTGDIDHNINVGIDYENAHGEFDRDQSTSQYYLAKLDTSGTFDCASGVTYCVDGEQYFDKRLYFAADHASATINLAEAYVEDSIRWKRLQVRAGVRVSYDDFMENTNVAPRLATSFDLFGNGRTVLIGGANRYYGRTLLAYKLREGSQPSQAQDLKLDSDTGEYSWVDKYFAFPPLDFYNDYRGRPYVYSELDTPYSDELALGINQELWGGRLQLTWVQRRGDDEFAREVVELPAVLHDYKNDEYYDFLKKTYRLTNNGSSEHDEYTLEWDRTWDKHYVAANITYQETSTSNENYNDEFYDEDLLDVVWYDGDYMSRDELPREDFNQPWIANIIYSVQLPYNVTFTNVTRYRSGYDGLALLDGDKLAEVEKEAEDRGINLGPAYKKDKKPENWVFDWRIDWSLPIQTTKTLQLTVEANNVFNQKVETGDPDGQLSYSTYELGRQFWLGMTYKF